jgi:hypothetical protein
MYPSVTGRVHVAALWSTTWHNRGPVPPQPMGDSLQPRATDLSSRWAYRHTHCPFRPLAVQRGDVCTHCSTPCQHRAPTSGPRAVSNTSERGDVQCGIATTDQYGGRTMQCATFPNPEPPRGSHTSQVGRQPAQPHRPPSTQAGLAGAAHESEIRHLYNDRQVRMHRHVRMLCTRDG